jgi:hypothetical protein
MTIGELMTYGDLLVQEQDNVKRVQLADAYLDGAELAGSGGSSMPENQGGKSQPPVAAYTPAPSPVTPVPAYNPPQASAPAYTPPAPVAVPVESGAVKSFW